MATIHEPPKRVEPSAPKPEQKQEPAIDPTAAEREERRSDRIHAALVLLAVVAVFALIVLLATLSPPPEGAEFQPWMMP